MKQNKLYVLFASAALAIFLFLPAPSKDLKDAAVKPEAAFPPPRVEAKAASAQDLVSGEVLFSKNAQTPLPLASLTKVISGLVILDYLDPDEEILISGTAISMPESSSLRMGEHLAVKGLLAMMIVESSNDAAYALFEGAGFDENRFLNLMLEKAAILGAKTMAFNNFTGLDISETSPGAYGSAEDLLAIARASLGSPLWQFGEAREVISREGIRHTLKSTNDLAPELTPLIGAKTGYTDLAGGNLLVIVEYPIGRPLGIVILGSSLEGRFSDTKKILEWIKVTK